MYKIISVILNSVLWETSLTSEIFFKSSGERRMGPLCGGKRQIHKDLILIIDPVKLSGYRLASNYILSKICR